MAMSSTLTVIIPPAVSVLIALIQFVVAPLVSAAIEAHKEKMPRFDLATS
jgi:hypothetical protein